MASLGIWVCSSSLPFPPFLLMTYPASESWSRPVLASDTRTDSSQGSLVSLTWRLKLSSPPRRPRIQCERHRAFRVRLCTSAYSRIHAAGVVPVRGRRVGYEVRARTVDYECECEALAVRRARAALGGAGTRRSAAPAVRGARAGRHRVPGLAAMRYGMWERATAVLEGVGTKSKARGEASCPRTHGDAAGDVVREARRSGPAARALRGARAKEQLAPSRYVLLARW
ncbi:hypothetical protein DFH09DRAFT_1096064 [Mycena vulgaris]|nr:hypothetical protein DFH09DRAFT_1096064 [Mycena vulgaris]